VGLMTIFYCLRFENSHFVASYDSQGYSGGIRPRLHTGSDSFNYMSSFYNSGTNRIEITVSNSAPYCVFIRCDENACYFRTNALASTSLPVAAKTSVSEPLSSNKRFVLLNYSGFQPSCHNTGTVQNSLSLVSVMRITSEPCVHKYFTITRIPKKDVVNLQFIIFHDEEN
jgi:hypothetical protein